MSVNLAELDNVWALAGVAILVAADAIDRRRVCDRTTKNAEVLTEIDTKVDVIKDEVKNNHPDDTNLRHDLDHSIRIGEANARANTRILDVLAKLGRDLADLRTFVGELRGADKQHSRDQAAFEKRVRDFFAREFPDAGPL